MEADPGLYARRIDRSKVADAVAETFLVALAAAGSDRGCRCCAAVALRHDLQTICHQWRSTSRARTLAGRLRNVVVVDAEERPMPSWSGRSRPTSCCSPPRPEGDRPGGPAPRAGEGMSRPGRGRPRHHARSGETAGVSRGATWREYEEVGGDGWTPAVGRRRCMSVEEQVVALFVAANPVRIQTCSSRSRRSTTSIRHRAGVTGWPTSARAVCARLVPSVARHCGRRCR